MAISLDPVVSYFLFSVGIRWAIRSISSSVFQLGRFGDPDRIALILVSSYYGPIFPVFQHRLYRTIRILLSMDPDSPVVLFYGIHCT